LVVVLKNYYVLYRCTVFTVSLSDKKYVEEYLGEEGKIGQIGHATYVPSKNACVALSITDEESKRNVTL
jgi:hypothetical protein